MKKKTQKCFCRFISIKLILTGRIGNKQSEIEQQRKLLPALINAELYSKAVQSAHSMAVHFYGFKNFDSCQHYSQMAQDLSSKYSVMQGFIGLRQYNAVCMALLGNKAESEIEAAQV